MVGNLAEAPASVGAALDVVDVSHRFDLDGKFLPVLSRISLRVEPGELVSLLGP
jgi:NitT/TauT family transport system ATP-binding protein